MNDISHLLELYDKVGPDEKPGHVDNHLKVYYHVFNAYSPYAEVRESVSNTDDPTLPVETFRAYFVGLLLSGFFSCCNQVAHSTGIADLVSFSEISQHNYRGGRCSSGMLSSGQSSREMASKSEVPHFRTLIFVESWTIQPERAYAYHSHCQNWAISMLCELDI